VTALGLPPHRARGGHAHLGQMQRFGPSSRLVTIDGVSALMVFKSIRGSVSDTAATWAFSMAACYATQDHPANIPRSQRWPFSSRTVSTVEWLTGWSRSFGGWRLLSIASMRAGCRTWPLYGLAVRLSSVPSITHNPPVGSDT
jgi:hypothetical protein